MSTHDQIARALAVLRPHAQWNLSGDALAELAWLDQPQTRPTAAEIDAEIARQAALPAEPLELDGADFMARVTDDEYAGVLAAAQNNVQVARWIDILRMRGTIDVNGKTAQAAKAGLVALGLLTAARAEAIFAAE